MDSQHSSAELLLLAHRYITGDLDQAKSAGFESLLESDADARAAVADAVLIGESLAPASTALRASASGLVGLANVQRSPGPWRPRLVLLTAVAALLLVASLPWLLTTESNDLVVGTDRLDVAAASELMVAWGNVLDPLPSLDPLRVVDSLSDDPLSDDPGDSEATDSVAADNAEEIPDWMLAAVCVEEDGEVCDPTDEAEAL